MCRRAARCLWLAGWLWLQTNVNTGAESFGKLNLIDLAGSERLKRSGGETRTRHCRALTPTRRRPGPGPRALSTRLLAPRRPCC
eukprot:COSAG01_NODE_1003_length_12216_cov_8.565350_10_plen_84_part_00